MQRTCLLLTAVRTTLSLGYTLTAPSLADVEVFLKRFLLSGSGEDMGSCLSCSALVGCVAAIEMRRQQRWALADGMHTPVDALVGHEMVQFLLVLSRVCGQGRCGCFAAAEHLWKSAKNEEKSSQRVTLAVKTLLNALDVCRCIQGGLRIGDCAAGADQLLRLELSLMELIVRIEGDIHGDVQEACHYVQCMQRTMDEQALGAFTAVERRQWTRRVRRLTTVVYPHLMKFSSDDEAVFRRTLHRLYGDGKTFGCMRKLQYGVGVLLPFILRSALSLLVAGRRRGRCSGRDLALPAG